MHRDSIHTDLRSIRHLSSDRIFLGLTSHNVFGLKSAAAHPPSHVEMLKAYGNDFTTIELKSDFQRLIDESVLHQIELAGIPSIFIRMECNSSIFKEQGVLQSDHWKQFISLLKHQTYVRKYHLILCWDRYTVFSPSLLESLLRLKDALYPLLVLVECEHRSWVNPKVLKIFRSTKQSVVQRDVPQLSGFHFTIPNYSSKLCYFRLLGRNRETWFSNESSQRYLYGYSRIELESIAHTIRRLKYDCDEIHVIGATDPPTAARSNILELARLLSAD
ncbi:MAG: DUF72 domain-containing protein [Bacteroidota bacterium]|nr:DUF72 domain-containing protein [Bacteroidota bacterium]